MSESEEAQFWQQERKSLNEVLDFYSIFEQKKNYYSAADCLHKAHIFVQNIFLSPGLFVVKFAPQNEHSSWSLYWNEEIFTREYLYKGMQNYLHNLKDDIFQFTADYFRPLTIDDQLFFIINLGQQQNNRYLGFFKYHANKEVPAYVMLFFARILYHVFQHCLESNWSMRLSSLVYTDDVTGLFNQRKLVLDLDDYIKKHKDISQPFSVLFIDIDYFKTINDGYGHIVGSLLLVEVATAITAFFHSANCSLYRYGGDEFVAILPQTSREQAHVSGKQLLQYIQAKTFQIQQPWEGKLNKGQAIKLGLSIGVATYPQDAQTKMEILSFADTMMYEAKKSGRGQVMSVLQMRQKNRAIPLAKQL